MRFRRCSSRRRGHREYVVGTGCDRAAGVEIYVASKHAVIGLTKSAALEFAKQGIRINAVLPAVIETDMSRRSSGEARSARGDAGLHPIGRIGTPEEIADAVIGSLQQVLVRHRHSLLVDGGFTAQ